MKDKIVAYFKKDTVSKLMMLGILIAAVILFWGWVNFFDEVKAFRKYEREIKQKVNCFPTWQRQMGEGA